MARRRLGILAAAMVLTASPALANNWRDCAGEDAGLAERACSRIISVRAQVASKAKLATAFVGRARARLAREAAREALADIDAALSLDGAAKGAQTLRGRAQAKLGQSTEALASLEAAIGADRADIEALMTRARLLADNRDFAAARRDLEAAIAATARDWVETAAQQEARSALAALPAGRPGTPQGPVANQGSSQGSAALATPQEWAACESGQGALAACARIIAADPGRSQKGLLAIAHNYRARAAVTAGDTISAAEDLRISAELAPSLGTAFNERALAYMRSGELRLAIADFDEAVRRKPDLASAYRDRARARLALRELKGAATDIAEATRLDPRDPAVIILRGLIAEAQGDLVRARAELDRALSLEQRPGTDPDLIAHAQRRRQVLMSGSGGQGSSAQARQIAPDWSRVPRTGEWEECRGNDADRAQRACVGILARPAGLSNDALAAAHYQLGLIHARSGRFEQAAAALDQALKVLPSFAAALTDRGLVRVHLGDLERAASDLDAAIAIDPADPRSRLNRGVVHERRKDCDRAIVAYTEALSLQPGYPQALVNRGLCYRQKGDLARAKADLEAALAASASSDSDRRAQEQAREVLAALAPPVQAPPIEQGARQALPPSEAEMADCRATRDADRAIEACSRIIARGRPVDVRPLFDAYRYRSIAWRGKGNLDQAINDANAALAINSSHADVYATRAYALERKGELAKALDDLATCLRINPRALNARKARAAIYARQQRWQEALSDYDEAVRLAPAEAKLRVERGQVLGQLREDDRALSEYGEAIRLNAEQAIAWSGRSGIYLRLGNATAALADANEALRLRPAYISALIHRGDAHRRLANLAAARADYQRALGLAPANERERRELEVARISLAALESPGGAVGAPKAGAFVPQPAAGAQDQAQAPAVNPGGLRRVALVIGNSAYEHVPHLDHPAIDAREVASALRRIGFDEVVERRDLTKSALDGELRAFGDLAETADWAVVYFSGHALQSGGRNHLLAIDAKLERQRHLEDEGIALERVLSKVREARGFRLVLLDACRENPFLERLRKASAGGSALAAGLAREAPAKGEVIMACAADGQVVADGSGANSPFTKALLARLSQGGEIARLLEQVRDDVRRGARGGVAPVIYGTLPASGLRLEGPKN